MLTGADNYDFFMLSTLRQNIIIHNFKQRSSASKEKLHISLINNHKYIRLYSNNISTFFLPFQSLYLFPRPFLLSLV